MHYRSLAALAALIAGAPLSAQSITSSGTIYPPASAAPEAQSATTSTVAMIAPSNAVLRAGAPIALRMLEEVTTKEKKARVGQRFRMEVASPVEYNGMVVIPAGSPAEGEITSVRNKGMWGKSGHLGARALWARVNGRQIRLAGTFDDKGVTGTAAVVGAIAFVPIAGFFVTGTSAVLPNGGQVSAFLDEDLELAVQASDKPAPLSVEASAPMPVAMAAPAGE
ncbi:hypothetical protein ACWPM1_13525 [Tsuneonella sp. HG249]